MTIYLQFALAIVASYLIGAFPSGVIASRIVGAPDVRYTGSKHTGGTNTMRQAGVWVGVGVVIADALKGLIAWGVAFLILRGSPWALPVAATMAVTGHCWPVYTRFHGGMGLATGGALILILSPLTIVFAIAIWAGCYFGLFRKQYSPRSVVIALISSVILTILFLSPALNVQWALSLMSLVIFIKHLPEWNRIE